jgi:hypothetical protein
MFTLSPESYQNPLEVTINMGQRSIELKIKDHDRKRGRIKQSKL